MTLFSSTFFLAFFLLHSSSAENVESYLQQQSRSIAVGDARGMLPRGTILMLATEEINNWFNLDGKGLGEYAGRPIFMNLSDLKSLNSP